MYKINAEHIHASRWSMILHSLTLSVKADTWNSKGIIPINAHQNEAVRKVTMSFFFSYFSHYPFI